MTRYWEFANVEHTLAEPLVISKTDIPRVYRVPHSFFIPLLRYLEDSIAFITSNDNAVSVGIKLVALVWLEEVIPVVCSGWELWRRLWFHLVYSSWNESFEASFQTGTGFSNTFMSRVSFQGALWRRSWNEARSAGFFTEKHSVKRRFLVDGKRYLQMSPDDPSYEDDRDAAEDMSLV